MDGKYEKKVKRMKHIVRISYMSNQISRKRQRMQYVKRYIFLKIFRTDEMYQF